MAKYDIMSTSSTPGTADVRADMQNFWIMACCCRLVQTQCHNVIPSNKLLCVLKWCAATQADSPRRFKGGLHTRGSTKSGPAPTVRKGPECRGQHLTYDKTARDRKRGLMQYRVVSAFAVPRFSLQLVALCDPGPWAPHHLFFTFSSLRRPKEVWGDPRLHAHGC